MFEPLPVSADDAARRARYEAVFESIRAVCGTDADWTAAQATVACELHHAFEWYHWTGFYRVVSPGTLLVGPYQGGHGCVVIPFERGVCGAAARTRRTQRWDDVHDAPDHIACSSSTVSELVVPVVTPAGKLLAVLDVDSDHRAAFRAVDETSLGELCAWLGTRFSAEYGARA